MSLFLVLFPIFRTNHWLWWEVGSILGLGLGLRSKGSPGSALDQTDTRCQPLSAQFLLILESDRHHQSIAEFSSAEHTLWPQNPSLILEA